MKTVNPQIQGTPISNGINTKKTLPGRIISKLLKGNNKEIKQSEERVMIKVLLSETI